MLVYKTETAFDTTKWLELS